MKRRGAIARSADRMAAATWLLTFALVVGPSTASCAIGAIQSLASDPGELTLPVKGGGIRYAEANTLTRSDPKSPDLEDQATVEGMSATVVVGSPPWAPAGRDGRDPARLQFDLRGKANARQEDSRQLRVGAGAAFLEVSSRRVETPVVDIEREVSADAGDIGREPAMVSLGMTLALTRPAWPKLTLSLTRTVRESIGLPFALTNRPGFRQADSATNSYSAQLSHTWRFLILNAGGTKVQTLDTTWDTQEKNILGYHAGVLANLWGGRVVLGPTISWRDSRSWTVPGAPVFTRTVRATLAATAILVPDELTFNGQVSLSRIRTNDHDDAQEFGLTSSALGERTVTAGFAGKFTWRIEKYLGNQGRQALSLRFNWDRIVDAVTPTNPHNEISAVLIFDVLSPFLF